MPEAPKDKLVTITLQFQIERAHRMAQAIRIAEEAVEPVLTGYSKDGIRAFGGKVISVNAETKHG